MSLNLTVLNGRLPHFDPMYKAADGEKTAFLSWSISVKRDIKPKDAQYYPEDLIKIKAFGPSADFIYNNFAKGDGLVVTGKLQKEDDYEKDGQKVSGGLYVLISSVNFADARTSDKNGASTKSNTPPAAPPKPGTKPSGPPMPGRKSKTTPPTNSKVPPFMKK